MCSKQARGSILVYYATFLIQKMCVQEKREPALYFIKLLSNTENVCSKQARGCYLFYSSLISIVCQMFYREIITCAQSK